MTNTQPTCAEILGEMQARDKKRQAQGDAVMRFNKGQIFPSLAAAGITHLTLRYDGSGDNGCTEEDCAFKGDAATEIPETIVCVQYQSWEGAIITQDLPLPQAIETMCMDIAETHHMGWENNEGAYGDFSFDIVTGTIGLEHHQRFEDYDTSTYAW